jgi:transcriptional regulator of acetoin/glycerol metabolism
VRQLDNLLRRALVLSEESARILACLEEHRWNVCAVARALGMPRNTLYRKLRKYRLQKP